MIYTSGVREYSVIQGRGVRGTCLGPYLASILPVFYLAIVLAVNSDTKEFRTCIYRSHTYGLQGRSLAVHLRLPLQPGIHCRWGFSSGVSWLKIIGCVWGWSRSLISDHISIYHFMANSSAGLVPEASTFLETMEQVARQPQACLSICEPHRLCCCMTW